MFNIKKLSKKQIKLIQAIKKSNNYRTKYQCFLVEGLKSIVEAIKSDFIVDFIIVSERFVKDNSEEYKEIAFNSNIKIHIISDELYETLSDTVTPQGIMAVVKIKYNNITQLENDNFILTALDKIKDPGNMGTIIRTADAAAAGGVILGKGCVDVFNPKVVRATMGSIFHVPLVKTDNLIETLMQLKKHGAQIVTTFLTATKYYYELDFLKPTVLVMGKEDEGVSQEIVNISDEIVKIPMLGKAESLNVSIAHGIILYETVKQRIR